MSSDKNTDNTISPSTISIDFPIASIEYYYKQVHPALDFNEDDAYVGLKLQYRDQKGERKSCLFLVTDKDAFQCTSEELAKRGIELTHSNLSDKEPRWSIDGLKKFVKDRESIGPEQLFNGIRNAMMEYIDFPDTRQYDFLTLWTIGTYFFPLFNAYPYVHVNGLPDTGKTKLLTLCGCLCFNAKQSGSMTTASLYRKIQNSRCTLLIDEKEDLSNPQRNEEFMTILLNGYKKAGEVVRCDLASTDFPTMDFEVYGPKMLANIAGLGTTLRSRCITIPMQPTKNKNLAAKKVITTEKAWKDIRDLLYPFLLNNWKNVRKSYIEIMNETELIDRDWEIWEPILAIARTFSNDLFTEMVELGKEKAKERKDENIFTPERDVVEALFEIVDKDDFYRLGNIKHQIAWNYDKEPSWLNPKYLANLLRKFGFSVNRKGNQGYEYFITVSKVKELAIRFGVCADSEQSGQSERPTEG